MAVTCDSVSGKRVAHLVVDAVGFLKNAEIQEIGDNVYSIQEVVNEIKDKNTKQRLQVLPYELKFREPSQDAINFITSFSKKTGDYGSLSATDIKVLALTYQLEREFVGTDHLRSEPQTKPAFVTTKRLLDNPKGIPGFYLPSNNQTGGVDVSASPSICADMSGDDEAAPSDPSEETNEADDESSWITPENVHEHMEDMGLQAATDESVMVACLTTDFAMQVGMAKLNGYTLIENTVPQVQLTILNVLMHVNSHVVSLDGMIIKKMKTFILRCHACFKTTSVMSKVFCPHCGNKTLKRVAVSINENGEQVVQVSFRRPINIRGTKFSLPLPKGGKHADELILCEDQRNPNQKVSNLAKAKLNALDPDYVAGVSPFALNDVYSKSANLGVKQGQRFTTRKNPNEACKRNRRKK